MMAAFDWSFGGFAFGNGANGIWAETWTGLNALPGVRTSDQDRPNDHGQYPGRDLAAGRTITLGLWVRPDAGSTLAARMAALDAAFTMSDIELPLVFEFPGLAARRIMARCRRAEIPGNNAMALAAVDGVGEVELAAEFYATDPRIYSDTLHTTAISLPTAVGGLTFDVTGNWAFGSVGTGGSAIITNAGLFPAPWVAVIAGPVTDPVIEHVGLSRQLRFTGEIAAGEFLVVDSKAKSALLNGTSSRYSWLTKTQWFDLSAGDSQINYRAASGSGAMSWSWRDAWIKT